MVWNWKCYKCYMRVLLFRLLARWGVSRHPVDSHFLTKIVLLFICCFINCSCEQALKHILGGHLSSSGSSGWKPVSIHCADQSQKNSMYISRLNSVTQGRTWLIQEFCLSGSPRVGLQNKTYSPSKDDCLKIWSTLSQLASDLESKINFFHSQANISIIR